MAEQEAPGIEDSLARSETDAQYSTLKFNYNVFLCSSCLFIKQVSSEGKKKNQKTQQSLLSSNRITRAYLYILQYTRLAWAPLLFLASLKRQRAEDLCVIFQESEFKVWLRREDKYNRAIDLHQCKFTCGKGWSSSCYLPWGSYKIFCIDPIAWRFPVP